MGNKYWTPENYKELAACEGFYVVNKVFFGAENPNDSQWEKSITELSVKLKRFLPTAQIVNDWTNCMGIRRYVLLSNRYIDIIMGEDEYYASIFLIIPETCGDSEKEKAKREFESALTTLTDYLLRKIPRAGLSAKKHVES